MPRNEKIHFAVGTTVNRKLRHQLDGNSFTFIVCIASLNHSRDFNDFTRQKQTKPSFCRQTNESSLYIQTSIIIAYQTASDVVPQKSQNAFVSLGRKPIVASTSIRFG
jgi:hypothetical protein